MVNQNPKLKRSLSLPILFLYGLGNIIGAGIYVLVGKVAEASAMNTPLAFVIAMFIAGLTALSYMELSSRFPKSSGSSLYIYKALGLRSLSLIVGLAIVTAGITSMAILAQGFAGYLDSVINIPQPLAASLIIVLLTLLALRGIGESAKFAALLTIGGVSGLLLIIWFGLTGGIVPPISEMLTLDADVGISGLLLGAFLAFYAFIGFEDMVNVVEEVKNPKRNMPLAILLSLVVGTILYLLVVIISIEAVPPDELAASDAPLSLVLERVSQVDPVIIAVISMAAALNGIIVQIIMGSRLLYGLSSLGWISKVFSTVHPRRHTPTVATLTVAGIALLAAVLLPLVSLAKATSFLVLIIFCLVNISLVVIKSRQVKPADKSITFVPIAVPILGALCTIAIVMYQALKFVG